MRLLPTILIICGCQSYAAQAPTCATVPSRAIPEPAARGTPYPVPSPMWDTTPYQLWGWTCELADGSGLAFGGLNGQAEDGNPHTRLKTGSEWKPMAEELRKKNPLQKRVGEVWALRERCKDTLAHARHLFYEGKSESEEAAALKKSVAPDLTTLTADLAGLIKDLKSAKGPGDYEIGQIKFALGKLEDAAALLKPFQRTSPEILFAMRRAQIALEMASEAFDAEPAPRALSKIAYDAKSKLFVLFGGEHMDYVTNDVWVFDPAKQRWFQRHPAASPEPRADHQFDSDADGTVRMRGGFAHTNAIGYMEVPYAHVGDAVWIYNVEKNSWRAADGNAEKLGDSDARAYRPGPAPSPYEPEFLMQGERPNAATNEAKLKALPINTWVTMNPPPFTRNRDWGTGTYDPDRDLLLYFGGGHCAYSGSDVIRYHLATNRWEMTEPSEEPLGGIGSNESYPNGVNFNRRPWMRGHTWNSYAYDPTSKLLLMPGTQKPAEDPFYYLYDPDRADWAQRRSAAPGMDHRSIVAQVRPTAHGMMAWTPTGLWLHEAKSMEWKKLNYSGPLPQPQVDGSGLVYDPKRDRMLFFRTGYNQPYDGQLYAYDFKSSQVAPLNPAGMGIERSPWGLREVAYHPDSDMFLYSTHHGAAGYFPAYDAPKNRWITIHLAGEGGVTMHGGCSYDAKRGLFWVTDVVHRGQVWVMRYDAAKAEIKPF